MSPNELLHDILLNLLDRKARDGLVVGDSNPQPLFLKEIGIAIVVGSSGCPSPARPAGNKDDLVFPREEVVAYDDLVAVSFECLAGFGEEEGGVCFELDRWGLLK